MDFMTVPSRYTLEKLVEFLHGDARFVKDLPEGPGPESFMVRYDNPRVWGVSP
jgi:hypothetical protein